jgi:hypothetical protein
MGHTVWCLGAPVVWQHPAEKKTHHTATKKQHRNISIFRNVEISYLPDRGPGVEGEEGIYGSGGVGPNGARGVCACRSHHGRSNDMRLEEFGLHLRELEVIEIGARWEFSLCNT